jgi:amino acid transporter
MTDTAQEIPTRVAERPRPVVSEDRRLRRDVGRLGLLFAGVGSIIGSGWLFGALTASQIAGPAAVISWVLGGLMILLIALVYAELGAMFPVSGGVVRYPHYAFGSFASYSAGWMTWIAAVTTTPIEVLATLQYATNYLSWLTEVQDGVVVLSWPAGYGVAVVLMFVYAFINVLGVRAFVRFNNVLVWWKLAIILLVIAAFFVAAFEPGRFGAAGGFAPYGADAIFSAIATAGIVFSYLGFRQGVELAGESRNPKRNVPFAVIGAVIVTMIIYTLLQVAFIGALPTDSIAGGWSGLSFPNDFGPLAGLAGVLGLTWLGILLYADAIVSPADTGLIYYATTSRIAYAMGRNGNAPRSLTKINDRGIPWVAVLLTFLVGLVVFLPFPGWQKLVGFITAATVLSFGSGPLVLAALRRALPEQERAFKLRGGDTIPFLGFYAANLIVFWTGWETNWELFVAVGIGYVLLAVFHALYRDRAPALEWRAGLWLIPWLLGLGVISLLGTFGGGLGVISFGWAFLVVLAHSAAIYVLAVKLRLAPQRVVEALRTVPRDEPAKLQA